MPSENATRLINMTKSMVLPRPPKYDPLTAPTVGDSSLMYRANQMTDYSSWYYAFDFAKGDTWEEVYITGSRADQELLKDLTKQAASKIE